MGGRGASMLLLVDVGVLQLEVGRFIYRCVRHVACHAYPGSDPLTETKNII